MAHILRPLPPNRTYYTHIARGGGIAGVVVAVSLVVGTVGYRVFEGLPWVDAVLNASMILTGMGPVDHPTTSAGKIFASCYAFFSALVFLLTATLLLTPIVRRGLHRMHMDMQEKGQA